jgi:hypothetical protein
MVPALSEALCTYWRNVLKLRGTFFSGFFEIASSATLA